MDLRTYLRKQKLSQSEFARRVGVTQGAVWQWLDGSQVSAEKAMLIEDATNGVVGRHELRPDLWPVRTRA